MNFHDRLKALREDSDLTQSELAKKLNISREAVKHYETSSIEPSIETLIKMADFFDVSVDYLIGRFNKRK